jgi:hypothetical protein
MALLYSADLDFVAINVTVTAQSNFGGWQHFRLPSPPRSHCSSSSDRYSNVGWGRTLRHVVEQETRMGSRCSWCSIAVPAVQFRGQCRYRYAW